MNTLTRLFGTLLHLDQSTGPPWAVTIWNPESAAFEAVDGFARLYLWDDAGTLLVDAHGDLITVR